VIRVDQALEDDRTAHDDALGRGEVVDRALASEFDRLGGSLSLVDHVPNQKPRL